ncbi:glycosyltransferase family 4 protein [Peristeroidobacter agariperforans]|uniref:glycosyltransferase family 4 protein n=1 Tax=Peristeroidobacter agariperforans TaxID=268404 RepID=UPI00101D0D47|nr:glycosyltransferase family 4 protein [Peristeroidobacter agariperforans]
MSLNIWLITVGEPLPLPGQSARPWRTGILAQTLAARGHRVTWWTSTVNHFTKEYFTQSNESLPIAPDLELQFLHGDLYRKNISFARFRNHRQIAEAFRGLARERPTPDLVLCSFPTIELSYEAVSYCRERSVPVLLDIRDLWPDEIEARVPRPFIPLLRVVFGAMYRQTREALRGASGLVAISEHYLAWGLGWAERQRSPADAVFTHAYPPPPPPAADGENVRILQQLGVDPDKRIACFIGTFVGSIDLATVVNAAKLLADRTDLQFVLAGSGEQEASLRALAQGADNIVFTSWVNQQQLAAIASRAWVGLGAYKKGALMSLTNKIFEYMAYGLPVVLSLPGEAQRLIEQARCGVFYEPGSAESLARQLRQLLDSPAGRDELASNAARTFQERYSSVTVYKALAAHLEQIAAQKPL